MIQGEHSGMKMAKCIYEILDRWNLKNKVNSFTLDNASMNDKIMEELELMLNNNGISFKKEDSHFRCLCHVLNIAVQESMEFQINTVSKVRTFFSKIKNSPKKMEQFKEKCRLSGDKFTKPQVDTPTRWSSTYNMLNNAFNMKNSINIYLNDSNQDVDLIECKLTNDDWSEIEELLFLYKKFADINYYLESESYPTITKTIPFFNLILDHLEDCMDRYNNENALYQMADAAWKKIVKYYAKTNEMNIVLVALDPRLNIQYLVDEGIEKKDIDNCRGKLQELIEKYAGDCEIQNRFIGENDINHRHNHLEPLTMQVMKKRKLNNTRRQSEIFYYVNEEQRNVNCDPLSFWFQNKYTFPRLSLVARDYLAIPATSAPSERCFSKCNYSVSQRRFALKQKSIRMQELLDSMNNFLKIN